TYYLIPEGPQAEEPYLVFQAAMERMERYGVGEVVFSEKEQLVLLRPVQGVLAMEMLYHASQFKNLGELKPAKLTPAPKKVELAKTLITAATEDEFDFSSYVDRYKERMKKL